MCYLIYNNNCMYLIVNKPNKLNNRGCSNGSAALKFLPKKNVIFGICVHSTTR